MHHAWDNLDSRSIIFMNLTVMRLVLRILWWSSGNQAIGVFFWRFHPGKCLEECLSGVCAVQLAAAGSNLGCLFHQLCSVIRPEEIAA